LQRGKRCSTTDISPHGDGIKDIPEGKPMAEKVKKLDLDRDYKKYLYFIDGNGNVCQKAKSGEGESKVLIKNAIERDNGYLYFIDKEGDVARSPRGTRKQKAA
jgi:hypothetical protein